MTRFVLWLLAAMAALAATTGCAPDAPLRPVRPEAERALVLVDSMVVPAVHGTQSLSQNWFALRRNGIDYVAVLSPLSHHIYVYRYADTAELVKQIPLAKEGPHGLQATDAYLSFIFVDPDTFLVWNSATQMFLDVDASGSVRARFRTSEEKPVAQARISGAHQAFRRGKEWIVPLSFAHLPDPDFTKVPAAARIAFDRADERWRVVRYIGRLPSVYNEGYWTVSARYKYEPFIWLYRDHLLVSFPLSHQIFAYDLRGQLVGSARVASASMDEFEPMRSRSFVFQLYERKVRPLPFEEEERWAATHSDYGMLTYLDGADLFVRVAHLRPSREQWHQGKSMDYSAILFTPELQVVGETCLEGERYDLYVGFTNEAGLHALDKVRTENSEDWFYFHIFQAAPATAQ